MLPERRNVDSVTHCVKPDETKFGFDMKYFCMQYSTPRVIQSYGARFIKCEKMNIEFIDVVENKPIRIQGWPVSGNLSVK